MKNEPVAWMETYKGEPNNLDWDKNNLYCEGEFHNVVPLYTHPVKEQDEQFKKGFEAGKEEGWKAHKFHHPVKELTDEEITDVFVECLLPDGEFDEHEFARAILRKAQEK